MKCMLFNILQQAKLFLINLKAESYCPHSVCHVQDDSSCYTSVHCICPENAECPFGPFRHDADILILIGYSSQSINHSLVAPTVY